MLQARSWLPRTEGSLRLAFQRQEVRTALDVLHQAGAAACALSQARGAGGSRGGAGQHRRRADGRRHARHRLEARRAGTSLTVTTAAAEKIYRARDGEAAIRVRLDSRSRRAACLAAAADHPVRRRAPRSPHRGRSCGGRPVPRRRNADLRPCGDGRGCASRRSAVTRGVSAATAGWYSRTACSSTAPSPQPSIARRPSVVRGRRRCVLYVGARCERSPGAVTCAIGRGAQHRRREQLERPAGGARLCWRRPHAAGRPRPAAGFLAGRPLPRVWRC